ncbi:hypothetical protein LOC71_12345 [Rhodopirellula sp. JC740]|uniref:Secreted protein n=1 Tax=Rhodopirellula halodulae TaxID=2894198 RepID=A0ABS8NHM0_9BACT|nr:hypothetical protein [Rhodopirellula sp. JC740]MCC9643068.1 hypothetical protein [Rhodopirellula sp. JC740]
MSSSLKQTSSPARTIGIAFWVACVLAGGVWLIASSKPESPSPVSAIWTHSETLSIDNPKGVLSIGDAAFAKVVASTGDNAKSAGDKTTSNEFASPNEWRQVGHVRSVDLSNQTATLAFYPTGDSSLATHLDAYSVQATLHRSSGKLDDVLATLLPKPKREQLAQKITLAMREHGREISDAMLPLVIETFRQSLPVIESELSASLNRHHPEIESLTSRFREEILHEQMLPLVRSEVLPVLQKHGREPAENIGREIWGRASLWRFGWRALYDSSPLPERELVREEWSRFVEQEVVPIAENHLDEISVAVEAIIRDLAANETLRDRLGDVALQVIQDEEARELLRTILIESVVENQRLREVWVDVWTSDEAREKLRAAGQRLEPVVREIADEVMGTRSEGIEPGFARVLRNQILGKDKVWLTLESVPSSGADPSQPVALRVATDFSPYPVVHLASPQ